MAILPILPLSDPRLCQRSSPVTTFDDALRKLVEDVAETMYAAPAVGLSAPQVGVTQRFFVLDVASQEEPSELRVFINPEILDREDGIVWEEGCASCPGGHWPVQRALRVRVRAFDVRGEPFELEAEGLLAVAIQHELDHLDGVAMSGRGGTPRR